MTPALTALYGGAVVFIAAVAAGMLLLRLLRLPLYRSEAFPAALAAGAPALALLMAAIQSAGLTSRAAVLILSAVLASAALLFRPTFEKHPPPGRAALLLTTAGMAALGLYYLANACAPDTTPAGFDDALAAAALLHRTPKLLPDTFASAVYLAPFTLGRHSATAVFHLSFLIALALAAASAARRISARWMPPRESSWSLTAALFVFASPSLAISATSARTEVLGSFSLLATLYFAWLAFDTRNPRFAAVALPPLLFAPAALTSAEAFPGFLFLPLAGLWAAIPFAAIAAAVLTAPRIAVLAPLLCFHLLTSWPGIAPLLAPSALSTFTPTTIAALTAKDTDAHLHSHLPGYSLARMLDEYCPPGSSVASGLHLPSAWTTRAVHPIDPWLPILETAFDPALRNDRIESRRFSVLNVQYLPIPLSSPAAEIRFYRRGNEIPRQPSWLVRCPEAFDNSLLTICTLPAAEANFGSPIEIDEIRVTGRAGSPAEWPTGLRRAAISELKRAGITHLLLPLKPGLAGDLDRNAAFWGVENTAIRDGAVLYALQ